MNVIDCLYKIKKYVTVNILWKKRFDKNTEKMKEFISKLGTPRDLIERSYFQYLCQRKECSDIFIQRIGYFFLNIICAMLLVLSQLLPAKKEKGREQAQVKRAFCILGKKIGDRIPESLYKEFSEIVFCEKRVTRITHYEKKYILQLWKRYPWDFVFVYKVFLKIGMYRSAIDLYGVNAIIAASEYSYTSSILTDYCHHMEIEHINIMHGEIMFALSRSFFAFDRCYVWDEYYKDLCITYMGAETTQFIIERPACLYFDNSIKIKHKYKYYLQEITMEQLHQIKSIMDKLTDDYMVRPHPTYTDRKKLRQVFPAEKIEDVDNVWIGQSIMEAESVIAWTSTVLYQAYCNGRRAIVDDITNKARYDYAQNAKYIMLKKGSKLLSEVLADILATGENQC